MTIALDPYLAQLTVSRETEVALRAYCALVEKWSPAINLVSRTDLPHLWARHVLDSAQIFAHARETDTPWADLGTGGGFPGVILAILSAGAGWQVPFTFVESDQRKAVFLRTAIRELSLSATVTTDRIESAPPLGAGAISARALAGLPDLLSFAHRHLAPQGRAFLLKGKSVQQEIDLAHAHWRFDLVVEPSITDPDACLLVLENIDRA